MSQESRDRAKTRDWIRADLGANIQMQRGKGTTDRVGRGIDLELVGAISAPKGRNEEN